MAAWPSISRYQPNFSRTLPARRCSTCSEETIETRGLGDLWSWNAPKHSIKPAQPLPRRLCFAPLPLTIKHEVHHSSNSPLPMLPRLSQDVGSQRATRRKSRFAFDERTRLDTDLALGRHLQGTDLLQAFNFEVGAGE